MINDLGKGVVSSSLKIFKKPKKPFSFLLLFAFSLRLKETKKDFPLIVCVSSCPFVNHREPGTSYRYYPLNSRTYIMTFLYCASLCIVWFASYDAYAELLFSYLYGCFVLAIF